MFIITVCAFSSMWLNYPPIQSKPPSVRYADKVRKGFLSHSNRFDEIIKDALNWFSEILWQHTPQKTTPVQNIKAAGHFHSCSSVIMLLAFDVSLLVCVSLLFYFGIDFLCSPVVVSFLSLSVFCLLPFSALKQTFHLLNLLCLHYLIV